MKQVRRLTLLTLAVALAAAPLLAQRAPGRQQRQRRPRQIQAERHLSPEGMLRLRERLELTEEQIGRLQALRGELVERRSQRHGEVAELTSTFRSGDITREEYRQQMTAQREQVRALAADRTQAGDVLTESQREQVSSLRQEAHHRQMRRDAFQRGRSGARSYRRGVRGFQGSRGVRGSRGMRGRRAQRPEMRRRGPRPAGSF